jgi:hypothetical protein
VVYVRDRIVALCETGQGQLDGYGEYWMGLSESGLMSDSELRGGRPLPVSVKDRSSGPGEQVSLCTDASGIYGVL